MTARLKVIMIPPCRVAIKQLQEGNTQETIKEMTSSSVDEKSEAIDQTAERWEEATMFFSGSWYRKATMTEGSG